MTEQAQIVLDLLDEKGISYEVTEHTPVFTIDEMLELNLPHPEWIAKNLFVRDDKKKNYYLLVVQEEKRIELKVLRKQLGLRPLTFASEEDLNRILNLTRGAVTPFGILNDQERIVQVLIDKEFKGQIMGIHPNVNTATVWISSQDLMALLKEHGNSAEYVQI